MTNNVYKFRAREGTQAPSRQVLEESSSVTPERPDKAGQSSGLVMSGLWHCVALVWPVLRWLLGLDVFYRALVALWHWNTPGSYAGWTFLLHFAVLTGLTLFVAAYRPKKKFR